MDEDIDPENFLNLEIELWIEELKNRRVVVH